MGVGWVLDRAAPGIWAFTRIPGVAPAAEAPGGAARDCPELDCVRDRLPPAVIAAAERRAWELGTGADRVLISAGHIDEEAYVLALAESLAIPFEPLDDVAREDCALAGAGLIDAVRAGQLALRTAAGRCLVVAPRGTAARNIARMMARRADLAGYLRLTSTAHLRRFAERHGAAFIGARAAEMLHAEQPLFSARCRRASLNAPLIALAALPFAAVMAPSPVAAVIGGALTAVFLAWIALRVAGLLASSARAAPPAPRADHELPVYTVIVALYREAASVAGLVAALGRLNYPRERLDIKLVLEPFDHATRAAVARLHLAAPFEVVIAPAVGPRTKPKALNAALLFARGEFTAVFDAEDRPEPDQLRLALDAFRAADERLACVQAHITIDNTADNWLTRVFTAEYAGLFDVFLPALARGRLPLPLGGSSNHFRTGVLREVGGWDPYNVTEDADLGVRLARFGYRTAMIDSTTYEEAPARLGQWMKQRTRWFKGWLQTWLVHMRRPLRLLRELGPAGFVTVQLVVGGTVLAALVHIVFALAILVRLARHGTGGFAEAVGIAPLGVYGVTLIAGYAVSGLLGYIGLRRRGLAAAAWALAAMPVHWMLLSLAAWRALIQLMVDPYYWEKTEHGLARTSRLARAQRRPAAAAHRARAPAGTKRR